MTQTLVTVALIVAALIPAGSSSASTTDRVVWEQWFAYELNRARWNPGQYAAENGLVIPQIGALPPLAPNAQLADSAGYKATEMAEHSYLEHRSAKTGKWPNELVRDHGFALPGFISDDGNNVEVVWGGGGDSPLPTPAAFLASPSHRTLFDAAGHWWYEEVNQVGVGLAEVDGVKRVAVHTARTGPAGTFVTGVAYDDTNGNGRMDLGEGLAGVTITVGASTATTNAGGGYSINVAPGTKVASASGDGFNGVSTGTFTVGSFNVGVDFISGVPAAEVRAFERCQGDRPTIMGTAGNDWIYGTSADDIIHGLDGHDRIWGYAGNDTICGGKGKDRLRGASGNDSLFGGKGKDRLFGGAGTNHLDGGPGNQDKCLEGAKVNCEV